jgi:hypothetical protein
MKHTDSSSAYKITINKTNTRVMANFFEHLGAFIILRKETIRFVMSVRPPARPHETTRLPLNGFSWNLTFEYSSKNTSRKFEIHSNLTIITVTSHEVRYTFLVISRSTLLGKRNISHKSCRENQNTHFMFNNPPPPNKSCRLWDTVEKYCGDGQATNDNMTHAHCIQGTQGYKYIYWFSTVTSAALNVYCLPCYNRVEDFTAQYELNL